MNFKINNKQNSEFLLPEDHISSSQIAEHSDTKYSKKVSKPRTSLKNKLSNLTFSVNFKPSKGYLTFNNKVNYKKFFTKYTNIEKTSDQLKKNNINNVDYFIWRQKNDIAIPIAIIPECLIFKHNHFSKGIKFEDNFSLVKYNCISLFDALPKSSLELGKMLETSQAIIPDDVFEIKLLLEDKLQNSQKSVLHIQSDYLSGLNSIIIKFLDGGGRMFCFSSEQNILLDMSSSKDRYQQSILQDFIRQDSKSVCNFDINATKFSKNNYHITCFNVPKEKLK